MIVSVSAVTVDMRLRKRNHYASGVTVGISHAVLDTHVYSREGGKNKCAPSTSISSEPTNSRVVRSGSKVILYLRGMTFFGRSTDSIERAQGKHSLGGHSVISERRAACLNAVQQLG